MAFSTEHRDQQLRKLRHDLFNDLNVLKMSLGAMEVCRDEPQEHDELIASMREGLKSLEEHLADTFSVVGDAPENSAANNEVAVRQS